MTSDIAAVRRTDDLAERFAAATGELSVLELILPQDLAKHRDAFLEGWRAGKPQDPVFEYADVPAAGPLAELAEVAAEAGKHSDPWHRLLAEESADFLDRYQAYAKHEPELLTEVSGREHGTPDDALLDDALATLANTSATALEASKLECSRIEQVLTAIVEGEELDGWSVRVLPNMAAGLSVFAPAREIRVRADTRLTVGQLVGLAAHEIGTHVFRWDNALRGARLLSLQLTGHAQTEEGLAVWNELRAVPGAGPDRRFALRVVGTRAALTGGFTDTVRALTPHTEVRWAFDIAARLKRGMTDTAAPGAFLKDHVYLAGLRQVERHLAAEPEDYALLMACKWPLHRLPLLREAGLPWPEQGEVRLADEAFAERVLGYVAGAL